MNYHFSVNNRRQELLQQFNELNNDINNNKRDLDKLKLEAEFYQDKGKVNKQSLADQIMKQLISDPYKPRYQPLKFDQEKPVYLQQPPHEPKPSFAMKQPVQPQRQNYIINERELQKNKLQNQKHQGLFPNSSDHNKIRSLGKQHVIPEQDRRDSPRNDRKQHLPTSPNRNEYQPKFDPKFNPFVPNEEIQRERKEEQKRKYLKDLQEQRAEQQIQRKRREEEKKSFKADLIDFHVQKQHQVKAEGKEKPIIMKRVDPNSKPPKIEAQMGNFSQFDKNLIKSKIIELKTKFKRGKVNFQQYERELNNLKKQYPGEVDELLEEEAPKKQNSPSYEKIQSPKRQLRSANDLEEEEPKRQNLSFPIKNESINYSQFMPSMVQPQSQVNPPRNNSGSSHPQIDSYPNLSLPQNIQGMVPPSYLQGAPPAQYMELLKKMFDFMFKEVRDVRHEQMSQNHVLQQTLNKFLTQNLQTQNMPSMPQIQKDFYSDIKQHREYFEKESNAKKKPMPSNESLSIPFGQSDNSEFYDKSLSAIASKVPISKRINTTEEVKEQKFKRSVLDQFYDKKYKVKPLKKFNILIDANQSQTQIPSTSSYLRAKNAKEQLKFRFQEDLAEMKKLQTDKAFKRASDNMYANVSYKEKRSSKHQQSKILKSIPHPADISPIAKQQSVEGNPYLKKNISTNDDNILTFNEKQIKINSPSGYSPVNKKQIFEQDEYQTEPRVREEKRGASNLIQQYEEKISHPSKALDFLHLNDKFLSKYQNSEESKKDFTSIKESVKGSDSKDYFGNNQISPVKSPKNYEQSLETIRSELVSVKQSHRPLKMQMNLNSPSEVQHFPGVRNQSNRIHSEVQEMGYSQTIQSVEESSSKLRKPPIVKKRSVSKKKENSISRSKLQPPEVVYSNQISESASFDPNYPKFDSNVYESQYEESVEIQKPGKINPLLVLNKPLDQQGQSEIVFNPPQIITPKGEQMPFQKEQQAKQAKNNQPQAKWKSLEEARKLAKQGRMKFDDNKEYRSVEQRFSELQSFMTKQGDESIQVFRQTPSDLVREKSKSKGESPKKESKKNINKLLEDLLEEDNDDNLYKQEFESYREQSENYQ